MLSDPSLIFEGRRYYTAGQTTLWGFNLAPSLGDAGYKLGETSEAIIALLGQDKWWAVPVATLVGIPMYADIFGTLSIAEALVGIWVGLGTVLAFMMAVTALSLPSLIMLKRVVKLPLLATFTGVVTVGILTIGITFNAITHWFI